MVPFITGLGEGPVVTYEPEYVVYRDMVGVRLGWKGSGVWVDTLGNLTVPVLGTLKLEREG